MNLLIFFALPFATILLSIVLQNVLKCPILVGITFFAIYLIVAFSAFSNSLAEALIATIVYTIIAFTTAYIIKANFMTEKENITDENSNTNINTNNNCCYRRRR